MEEPVAPEPVDPPLSDLGPVHADTVHPEAVDPPSSDLGPVHVDTVDQEPVDQDTVDSEPVDPDDELFVLGERCAQAYMKADALAYEAMVLLAEFDRRRGWEETGFSSTAEWLAWRIGIKPGAARERVRTALALESLPETSQAMRNGELSFTKVRALTRVATAENEDALLGLARAGSAANLERVVRGWQHLSRASEVGAEQMRYRSRTFSAFIDDDGMVRVRGRLDPESGAMLMRAIEAAGDALFRGEARRGRAGDRDETTPEQRRADALGFLAERALAAGFTDGPLSGSRADRTQVVLHVEAATLTEDTEPGRSELEDGTRVSAETSRRIACDTGVIRMTHGDHGRVLDVGRRRRSVPPGLRRALEARDRGCRFPGCGLRFTDAHHVKHWADGGDTALRNLVLLCRRHHRVVHEGGVTVCIDKDHKIVFLTQRGAVMSPAPRFHGNVLTGGNGRVGPEEGGVGLEEGGSGEKRRMGPAEGGSRRESGGSRLEDGALAPRHGSRLEDGESGPRNGGSRPEDDGSCRGSPVRASHDHASQPALNGPPVPASLQLRPSGWDGSARWQRDSQVPWEVEARAWDALDEAEE